MTRQEESFTLQIATDPVARACYIYRHAVSIEITENVQNNHSYIFKGLIRPMNENSANITALVHHAIHH